MSKDGATLRKKKILLVVNHNLSSPNYKYISLLQINLLMCYSNVCRHVGFDAVRRSAFKCDINPGTARKEKTTQ